jgi:hypothetical protein
MQLLDASTERMGHTGFVVKYTFDLEPGKYLVQQVVGSLTEAKEQSLL